MKAFTIILAGLLSVACTAEAGSQNLVTESREVGNFTGVTFVLPGNLMLIQGDAVELRVTATPELLEEIVTEVTEGVLEIRHRSSEPLSGRDADEIAVEVTYVTLDGLRLSGSGNAIAEAMECGDLDVTISGSAAIGIGALSARSVSVAVSGSGHMTITGLDAATLGSNINGSGSVRVDAQSISISGSGDHRAAELQSKDVETVIAGSGTAEVWATETLDAVIAGSGDVLYRGEPEVSAPQIAGSGSVRQLKREI